MQVRHLNALRALEATLRLGSFAAAAGEIGVTPTALGRAADPGRLSVTLPASLAENWLARRISAFHAAHPEADIRLDASNRMADLATEPFDFALRWAPPAGADRREDTLFGDWVLPVSTPEFARAHALAGDGVRLDGVPLVHLENRTPDPDWADWPAWAAAYAPRDTRLSRGPRYTRVGSGLQPALSGQGLVLASRPGTRFPRAASSRHSASPAALRRLSATAWWPAPTAAMARSRAPSAAGS